jgi:hypothetical protein
MGPIPTPVALDMVILKLVLNNLWYACEWT